VEEDPRLKLAYDEGVRLLDQQQAVVDDARSRVGLILSAGAVVAGLLGGQALEGSTAPAWTGVAAVVCFVALAAAAIFVWWPRDWDWPTSPTKMLDTYVYAEQSLTPNQVHEALARNMEKRYRENKRKVGRLTTGVIVTLAALAAEVFFLSLRLLWR